MKVLYVGKKDTIELSCPKHLDFIFKFLWRSLKVKTVTFPKGRGIHFTSIIIDECATKNEHTIRK